MEIPLSSAVAEHLLSLFASDLDGARSALEICCVLEKNIPRDRVTELEQGRNPKQTVVHIPEEESRLVKCESDLILLVSSFLHTKEKVQFRNSSLGIHSSLLGCAIDLTETSDIRKLATIEFAIERIVPFRIFSKRNRSYREDSIQPKVDVYKL